MDRGEGERRSEEARFLHQEMRVSLLSPSLPGRIPRGGRAFYYLRRGPLKAMSGNEQRGPKKRGPTQINAVSGRESSCVYAHARVYEFTCERAGKRARNDEGPRRFTTF